MHIIITNGDETLHKDEIIGDTVECLMTENIKTKHSILIYDICMAENLENWIKMIDYYNFKDVTEEMLEKKPVNTYDYVINSIGVPYKIDIQVSDKAHIMIYNGDLLLPDITDLKEFRDGVMLLHKNKWTGITLSSCSMKAYRSMISKYDWSSLFQDSNKLPLYEDCSETVEAFLRRAYKGGWCCVKEDRKGWYSNENGVTLDVNSLYPYIMSTQPLPYGKFTYFEDKCPQNIIEGTKKGRYFYYQEIQCKYKLKDKHLPIVQKEDDFLSEEGEGHLVFTHQELELFLEHYDVEDFYYIQGIYYKATRHLFKRYVDIFYPLKEKSSGSIKKIYKGFLNYLGGNMAKKTVRFNIALKPSPHLYRTEIKTQSYIQIGAAITSLARCKIIRDAQAHYNNFIYTDTDSLHLIGDIPDDLEISNTKLGAYKVETVWNESYFWGKKTYGEQTKDKLKLTLAGVPNETKEILEEQFNHKLITMTSQTGEEDSPN